LAWDKSPSDSTGTDTTLGIPHAVEIRISRCPHWTPAVVSNVFTHEDHYETALIDLINKNRRADCEEGATRCRYRRQPYGRVAREPQRSRAGKGNEEVEEVDRAEGDAAADRGQEA